MPGGPNSYMSFGWLGSSGVAILAIALSAITTTNASAQNNSWFDRWLNGDRGSSYGTQRKQRRSSSQREKERAKLDQYLRNDKVLLSNETIYAMDMAIARYRRIVASGGWAKIPKQKGAWEAALASLNHAPAQASGGAAPPDR